MPKPENPGPAADRRAAVAEAKLTEELFVGVHDNACHSVSKTQQLERSLLACIAFMYQAAQSLILKGYLYTVSADPKRNTYCKKRSSNRRLREVHSTRTHSRLQC